VIWFPCVSQAVSTAAENGWAFRQDGPAWRRVVPSPQPRRILEIEPITWLVDRGAVVTFAGGGGIPTMYRPQALAPWWGSRR
jgi:carbamate kinase